MAPTLVPRLFQEVVAHTIDALGFLATLPNPVDGEPPLAVSCYPEWPEMDPVAPFVRVGFRPGRHDFDVGENFHDFDEDTSVTKYGIYLPRSVLRLTVHGRTAGECNYIGDCLYSGIVSNFALQPTTGEPVEGAVLKRFAETAITITGCDDLTDIAADPTSLRPYGQLWRLVLPFRANVEITWEGTPYTPLEIDVTARAYSADDSSYATPLTTETFVVS